jgi:hypothetical protein
MFLPLMGLDILRCNLSTLVLLLAIDRFRGRPFWDDVARKWTAWDATLRHGLRYELLVASDF